MLPNLSRLSSLTKPIDEFFVILTKEEAQYGDDLSNELYPNVDPRMPVQEGEEDKVAFRACFFFQHQQRRVFLASFLWEWLLEKAIDEKDCGTLPTTNEKLRWGDWVDLRDRFGPRNTTRLQLVRLIDMHLKEHWHRTDPTPDWLRETIETRF